MFELGSFAVVTDESNMYWGCFGEVIGVSPNNDKYKIDLVAESKEWFHSNMLQSITEEEYEYLLDEERHFEQLMEQGNFGVTYISGDVGESIFDKIFGGILNAQEIERKAKLDKIGISEHTKKLCDRIQFKDKIDFTPLYANMYDIKQQINSILDFELDKEAIKMIKKLKKHHDYLLEKLDSKQNLAYNMYCKQEFNKKLKQI